MGLFAENGLRLLALIAALVLAEEFRPAVLDVVGKQNIRIRYLISVMLAAVPAIISAKRFLDLIGQMLVDFSRGHLSFPRQSPITEL
jgi:hypothetical protein